ncbi:hypothetical protein LR48_Vigan11g167800 [Vigna angularis]|uniref:Uncharacterized protein n=2 Tax=Phaseolus angularis TaxID=3914 RepID=A0A0L9VV28_PHAAN|nr:uncharacterized protein LOC108347314 isoform X2 [Vigna angularis]KOM58644.1 hypothetical protein LR48_Vigan11g167800 [Vigna angularis]
MGLVMSYMGGTGVEVANKGMTMITGTLYDRVIEKREIKNFDDFHTAILDIFNAINMALPGKHYDAPPHDDIKKYYYNGWSDESDEDKRKEAFKKFMNENLNLSKADESMMITGIVAPPVAMVVKKTGQTVPQLSVIKAIPDVAFVPGATILALIAIKLTKRMAFKNIPSIDQKQNAL